MEIMGKNPGASFLTDDCAARLVAERMGYKVHGYYDGDGTKDIALFRGSSGLWAIQGITRAYFGGGDDIPVTR